MRSAKRLRILLPAALTILLCLVGAQATPAQSCGGSSSTFDSGLEGWTEQDPAQIDIWWEPAGGNPGGYLHSYDVTGGSARAGAARLPW
jgi:hypothetical protein